MNTVAPSIALVIQKDGRARFISHLDLLRLMYRALRRADVPLAYSQGFSPRPRVSFGAALKVGAAGTMNVTVALSRPMPVDEFRRLLSAQLVEGVSLVSIDYGD